MLYPTSPNDLRRRRVVVLGASIAVLAIVVIAYALVFQRSASTSAPSDVNQPALHAAVAEDRADTGDALSPLAPANDPETFARLVAEALFAWDTATIIGRNDHLEQLVASADPTGESTPGLVADLDNYLPTPDAWTELARYETRQGLSIDSVTTPATWADAEAQAGDELLPGTTAFTIHGTRHRAGIWEGDPVASTHSVSFTIFIVCAPSYPECHLLRLSMLDKPLE